MIPIDLRDKVSIVTGGAMGLGRAITLALLQAGSRVVVADISEEAGSKLLQELEGKFSLHFIRTDVTRLQDIENMVRETREKFGKIDILVNNAGINIPRLLVDPVGKEEIDEAIFDKMVQVNQKGVVFCTQAVAREMIRRREGVIINISSECGLEGSQGQSIYAGTKGAIYAYTRSWAKELGKFNIRVVGVAPGILEPTALRTLEYERSLAYTRGISVEELRKSYEKLSIPLGRVGRLEEVAWLVVFLASELASYITGTVVNISGGKTRG